MCEWTGDCGAVNGTKCSSKCIASLEPLASVLSTAQGVAGGGLLTCSIVSMLVYETLAARNKTSMPDTPWSDAAPGLGCPSSEALAALVDNDLVNVLAQATQARAGVPQEEESPVVPPGALPLEPPSCAPSGAFLQLCLPPTLQ